MKVLMELGKKGKEMVGKNDDGTGAVFEAKHNVYHHVFLYKINSYHEGQQWHELKGNGIQYH